MNPTLTILSLVLVSTVALAAQEGHEMPNPKTDRHDALAALVGTWRTEAKMAAMPGVPGMEKPTEWVGIERAELICNGLWLKVTGESTCNGQIAHGMWMLGYDPHAKTYQCIAVSSMDDACCTMEATYDAATKTWGFQGNTSMGQIRSSFVLAGADRSVETCYTKDEHGKETEFMRAARTRTKDAVAKNAKTEPASLATEASAKLSAPLQAIHADCGTWKAAFSMKTPGAPEMTATCREVVEPICGGKWTWSTFTGEIMGAPFEGHALTGYDGKRGKVVSYWFDSTVAPWMGTEGTYDAGSHTFAMRGSSYGPAGEKLPVTQTATRTGDDSRTLRMTFGEGDAQGVMTIAYTRAKK